MERNAEKMPVEVDEQDSGLHMVKTPHQGGGAKTLILPSACHARQSRPEIAVLGWSARSYRLALRQGKA
jgi:hypothetical protein